MTEQIVKQLEQIAQQLRGGQQLHECKQYKLSYDIDNADQFDELPENVENDLEDLNKMLLRRVAYGHYQPVSLLLDRGATANYLDDQPLCLASKHGYQQIVRLLMDRGAGTLSLYDAFREALRFGQTKILEILYERGTIDAVGVSPFIDAVCNDHMEAVRFVLYKGLVSRQYIKKAIQKSDNIDTIKFLTEYLI